MRFELFFFSGGLSAVQFRIMHRKQTLSVGRPSGIMAVSVIGQTLDVPALGIHDVDVFDRPGCASVRRVDENNLSFRLSLSRNWGRNGGYEKQPNGKQEDRPERSHGSSTRICPLVFRTMRKVRKGGTRGTHRRVRAAGRSILVVLAYTVAKGRKILTKFMPLSLRMRRRRERSGR